MTSQSTHIFILTFLALGLLSTGIVKNYHYVKFYATVDNEKIDALTLILRIIGSKFTGLVWIFPFSIQDNNVKTEAQKHKEQFNKTSKYFFYFWTATILYALLYTLLLDK